MIPKEASPERLKDITETVGAAMPLDWHLSIKAELLSHIAWLTAEKESETRWAKQYSDEAEQLKSANAGLREVVDAAKELAHREAGYRLVHNTLGYCSKECRMAWDLMREAGDNVRAALARVDEAGFDAAFEAETKAALVEHLPTIDKLPTFQSVEEYRRASAALSRVKEKHENG